MKKTCSKCNKLLPIYSFYRNKLGKFGVTSICKTCILTTKKSTYVDNKDAILKQKKEYYAKNAEVKRQKRREYYHNNKSLIGTQKKKYYERNKTTINSKNRIWKAKKLRTSTEFRIKTNIRARLNKAVKHEYKSSSAVRDLGCTVSEFKRYIETQFKPGMTWDNWGSVWHLDHKKPLSNFDLSKALQFKEAVHFTNYQPMLVENNLKKGESLPKVYFIFGPFGSGKTTLISKLKDLAHVYSYDDYSRHPWEELTNPPDFNKPIIYETPVLTNQFLKDSSKILDVCPIFLDEPLETIIKRLRTRGRKVNKENIQKRITRLNNLANRHAEFSGTAEECLNYLKEQLSL